MTSEETINDSLQKRAMRSKKFIAFILGTLVTSVLLSISIGLNADKWVQRILAFGMMFNTVGYVLGVVLLERMALYALSAVKGQLPPTGYTPVIPPISVSEP